MLLQQQLLSAQTPQHFLSVLLKYSANSIQIRGYSLVVNCFINNSRDTISIQFITNSVQKLRRTSSDTPKSYTVVIWQHLITAKIMFMRMLVFFFFIVVQNETTEPNFFGFFALELLTAPTIIISSRLSISSFT